MLFVTRLGGLRDFFFFFKGSEVAIGNACCLGELEVFFKGKRGWGSPAESTWLSPSSGGSAEVMAAETLKCGSSGWLPAAPGTGAKQGRCLLFGTLGLFSALPPTPPFLAAAGCDLVRGQAAPRTQLLVRARRLC